jgi:diguanylate cyclase (GGDEF)-like protein
MVRKKQITNKTLVLTALIGSFLILVMMSANTMWASKQAGAATDEAVSAVSAFYLEAMADRRAKAIKNLIDSSFDQMERGVAFIENEQVASQEELQAVIGTIKALLGLGRFALVDEDNIVYTQYTSYTGRSRHAFLNEDTIKGRTISTVSVYGPSKQLCLAIPTPGLTMMGKPFKACFVQLDIREIVDLLALDDEERTHFALYSKNGGNLSGTELGPVIGHHNFFDALRGLIPDAVWEENRRNFENGADGSITFASGEAEETLCYVPIHETGWELAVLIRESVIQDQIRDVSERHLVSSRAQVIFTLVSVLLLAAILLLQYRQLSRQKLEQEMETSRTLRSMANTDSLTGVRNKHAYTENEAALNQQIQAGGIEKLAIVVGDINGLKFVNDTQGHAAGDQLIKDACALICEYFKHGAVFRIGGDEFVVLLQGKGYDTLQESARDLNRRVEENIKTHEVVVSIGWSVLEQGDRELRDVFERADQMMYERKKELKAMGAPSSRE